MKDYTALEI